MAAPTSIMLNTTMAARPTLPDWYQGGRLVSGMHTSLAIVDCSTKSSTLIGTETTAGCCSGTGNDSLGA